MFFFLFSLVGLNRSFLKLHPTAELGKSFVTFSNSFLIKEFLMEKYDVTQSVSDYGPTGRCYVVRKSRHNFTLFVPGFFGWCGTNVKQIISQSDLIWM